MRCELTSDTYELHFKTRGEDLRFTNDSILVFKVWHNQKSKKTEVQRICAIARALRASDDFEGVKVVRKSERVEDIEIGGNE